MMFTVNYDVAPKPWWVQPGSECPTVAGLVEELREHQKKIEAWKSARECESNDNEKYLEFGNLHLLTYLRECLVGEASIPEGSTVTDVDKMLNGTYDVDGDGDGNEDKRSKLTLKVQNMRNAFLALFPNVFKVELKIEEFTPEYLKKIHSIVGENLIEDSGEYRTQDLDSMPSGAENYRYLDPDEISKELGRLCAFIREELTKNKEMASENVLDVVKIAATFMSNFLQIHPFRSGNGRVARLATSLLLSSVSVVPAPLFCNSDGRKVYLDCLHESRVLDGPFKPAALAQLVMESLVQTHQQVLHQMMDTNSTTSDSTSQQQMMADGEERQREAELAKESANAAFKNQDYNTAVDLYTKAIELCPSAVYYANRSLAYLRIECVGYALSDGSKAVELDKGYVKGYYRRAAAYMSLGKFKLALKDFEAVAQARPNDKDAKLKLNECSKIVRKLAFEKAIAVDEIKKSVADSIDIDAIEVDDSYEGPKLENGTVTREFMEQLQAWYRKQKVLHRKFAYKILLDVRKYFMEQPTLVRVVIPDDKEFTVCGDIHGQFYDLCNIFEINGLPSESNPYLFNGDFVDRGSFSVECIFTLFGYKLLYPDHFFMSRGNHESVNMNSMYGFEGEVKAKYNAQMVDLFTEVYNWLPLCHLLNNRALVMHGGLFSTDDVTLEDLEGIYRNRQPPDEGLMCEILWSDPQPQNGRSPSKRGVGTQFGPDVTANFLKKNKLDYIIRSHEVKPEGYEVAHGGQCITVFSAPNYCDSIGNKGAIIRLKGDQMVPKYISYEAVPHPDIRPMAYANSVLSMMC